MGENREKGPRMSEFVRIDPHDDTFARAQKLVRALGLIGAVGDFERKVFRMLEAFQGWDIAEEREACAKLCEQNAQLAANRVYHPDSAGAENALTYVASAIRART